MAKKPIRVGFDLDGVLLYNPARIIRPFVTFTKKRLLNIEKTTFFVPKTPLQKWLWKLLHYSSLFIAPGLDDVKRLVNEGKIEAYIITGRYGFLAGDFEKWLKKLDANPHFKKAIINSRSEQPHLFKKRIIKDLDLDIFIEDNWDIVRQLRVKSKEQRAKIFWIYNIFDRNIEYPHKFPTLKKVVQHIGSIISSQP